MVFKLEYEEMLDSSWNKNSSACDRVGECKGIRWRWQKIHQERRGCEYNLVVVSDNEVNRDGIAEDGTERASNALLIISQPSETESSTLDAVPWKVMKEENY